MRILVFYKLKNRRKTNWVGHTVRRNCWIKHVIYGMKGGKDTRMEMKRKKRKYLLDDVKEKKSFWQLKEETADRTL